MKTEIAGTTNGGTPRLITQDILAAAPKLYSNERKARNEVPVIAKFVNPCGLGTWYMTEYDPVERRAFGLCVVYEPELGYFNVDDLESIELDWGLGIQRDPLWQGTPSPPFRAFPAACNAVGRGVKIDQWIFFQALLCQWQLGEVENE